MRNILKWKDVKEARLKDELTHAERQLLACCQKGQKCTLGDGNLPTISSSKRRIRADLLRYVIMGGCDSRSFHDVGVVLSGAYVVGELNLTMARAKGATGLINCYFEEEIQAFQTHFNALNFMGSVLMKGLFAQGCNVEGSLLLNQQFLSEGQIRLSSARIKGNLDCTKGSFCNDPGHALNLQGATIGGNAFLADNFLAQGEVRLLGAKIEGLLDCSFGCFYNADKAALDLRSAEIKEFKWRNVSECVGKLNLGNTTLGTLQDDVSSWEKVSSLRLIGCKYRELDGLHEFETRKEWLEKGSLDGNSFSPQPYTQLAKVFRTTGHDREARRVLFEKECRLSADAEHRGQERLQELSTLPSPISLTKQQEIRVDLFRLRLSLIKDRYWSEMLRSVVGFGYMPFLSAYWATGIIGVTAILSLFTYILGGMVPNSDIIMVSDSWVGIATHDYPAHQWLQTKAGQHYETFNALAYAADVFIPLVPLGQEDTWAPTTKTFWGTALWVVILFIKPLGWVITALGAAAIAGLIRRE